MLPERPDISDFAPHVGEAFRMDLGGGQALQLELVQVEDLGRGESNGVAHSNFVLLFRSPGERRNAPQRIYSLEHDTLGRFDVFLVPRGPDQLGMTYDAVYN